MRSEREESYEPYRLYRKIANATKTAVMIQRTILLLLLLFSSAIAVKYTIPAKEVQVRFKLPRDLPARVSRPSGLELCAGSP